MLRGCAKITQIETFLNQAIHEKFMLEQDAAYEENPKALQEARQLKRDLMKKLFSIKNKNKQEITGLSDCKNGGAFLEKFVNSPGTIEGFALNKWNNITKDKPGPVCHGGDNYQNVKSKEECLTKLKAKAREVSPTQKIFGTYLGGGAGSHCRYGVGSSYEKAKKKCDAKPWSQCTTGGATCENIELSGKHEVLKMGQSPSQCPKDYKPILNKIDCLRAARDLKLSNPRTDYFNFDNTYVGPGCFSYKFNNSTFYYNPATKGQPLSKGWGNMGPVCKKDHKGCGLEMSHQTRREGRLGNTISDGCWNCRSIIGWLGCNAEGTASKNGSKHDDWIAKCPATCKSYNNRTYGECKPSGKPGYTGTAAECAKKSWKHCEDGAGAKCGSGKRIPPNQAACMWVDKCPPTVSKNIPLSKPIPVSEPEIPVNTDYTVSEEQMNDIVGEKHELMKKIFDANEKNYMDHTRLIRDTLNSRVLRDISESNINNMEKHVKKKRNDLKNDLMSQGKLFQIKENEYRKKQYYIFIWKHVTSFSIISLLTALFLKTNHISSSNATVLFVIYFIVLLLVLVINHIYFNRRNTIYFNKYNWKNTKAPKDAIPDCAA